jgi:hypothetical protein
MIACHSAKPSALANLRYVPIGASARLRVPSLGNGSIAPIPDLPARPAERINLLRLFIYQSTERRLERRRLGMAHECCSKIFPISPAVIADPEPSGLRSDKHVGGLQDLVLAELSPTAHQSRRSRPAIVRRGFQPGQEVRAIGLNTTAQPVTTHNRGYGAFWKRPLIGRRSTRLPPLNKPER